jgi:phage terminase large subunit-like protein
MQRLTDKRTAEALRHNTAGLMAKGFNVPIDDLRYIKLAEYENEEERKERSCVNYDQDEWYE